MPKANSTNQTLEFPRHIVLGNTTKQRAFLIERAMRYLAIGMEELGIPYAVTGRAVGFDMGMNGPPEKITVALLDQDPLATPNAVEQRISSLVFDEKYRLFKAGPITKSTRATCDIDGQYTCTQNDSNLLFTDDRISFTRPTCKIAFFKVEYLPLLAQMRYSHVVKSRYGLSMTSPFFVLLDYLVSMTRQAQRSIESGNAKIVATTSFKGSSSKTVLAFNHIKAGKIKGMVLSMLRKQSPGDPDDCQFLEQHHIEAVQYMSSLVPEMASFPPFQSIFSQPIVVKPKRQPLPVVVEMPPSSTLRSLHWVAETTLNALNLRGLSGTMFGGLANAMYGIQTEPTDIKVLVYGPPQHQLNEYAMQNLLVAQDPKHFKIIGLWNTPGAFVLYCRPSAATASSLGFKFSIASKAKFKNRCQVHFIFPEKCPLSPIIPLHWVHIHSLPLIPYAIALLHQLDVWYENYNSGSPQHKKDADQLFEFLQPKQEARLAPLRIARPWQHSPLKEKIARNISKEKVKAFVAATAHGRASKAEWTKLGLFSEMG